jgi:type IV pilus assembly protein PilF
MMRDVPLFVLMGLLAACTTTTNLAGVPEKPATKVPPESRARVHTELAALYYQQASFKTALSEIDTALRVDAAYAPAYDMRGLVYMQLGERIQASDNFRKAIELAPGDPDIRNNYGWFLCTSGQPQAGLQQLELAWKNPLYDTPGRALANASRCAAEAGDSGQAKIYRERAATFGESVNEPPSAENLSLPKTSQSQ